jgi:hypothetical protein
MPTYRQSRERAKKRRAGKREYDPAWVYFVGGVVCLGAAALYALLGDHTAKSVVSARGIRHIQTPIEIYLATVGIGLALIVVGVRKVLRSKKRLDREGRD